MKSSDLQSNLSASHQSLQSHQGNFLPQSSSNSGLNSTLSLASMSDSKSNEESEPEKNSSSDTIRELKLQLESQHEYFDNLIKKIQVISISMMTFFSNFYNDFFQNAMKFLLKMTFCLIFSIFLVFCFV